MRNPPLQLKADHLFWNFITITKFQDTAMRTVGGVIIFKTVLFTFLHNIFRWILINHHGMKKRLPEFSFNKMKEDCKICYQGGHLAFLCCYIGPDKENSKRCLLVFDRGWTWLNSGLSFQNHVPMENGTAFHKWDDDITSMTYEDILATAILNKVCVALSQWHCRTRYVQPFWLIQYWTRYMWPWYYGV